MLAGTASMLVGCASGSESGAGSVAAGKDDALKVDSDGKSGGTDSDVSEFYEHVISVSALAKTYAIGEKIVAGRLNTTWMSMRLRLIPDMAASVNRLRKRGWDLSRFWDARLSLPM